MDKCSSVLIGRLSNGWNTTGYVARIEPGPNITAPTPAELIAKLEEAGIDRSRIILTAPEDGDRSLPVAIRHEFNSLLKREQDGPADRVAPSI